MGDLKPPVISYQAVSTPWSHSVSAGACATMVPSGKSGSAARPVSTARGNLVPIEVSLAAASGLCLARGLAGVRDPHPVWRGRPMLHDANM